MFRPNLKQTAIPSLYQRQPKTAPIRQDMSKYLNACDIIGPLFLQKCKLNIKKQKPKGLSGIINTTKHYLPPFITRFISQTEKGTLEYNDGFCWFYINGQFFIWEYNHNSLQTPLHICHEVFADPITAVYACSISSEFSQTKNPLVLVATGQKIQFFQLIESQQRLNNLKIVVMGSDVVTKLCLFNEPNQMNRNYKIPVPYWVVYGQANGSINLFDFRERRKYQTDSILSKINRKVNAISHNNIKNMIVTQTHIYCLYESMVNRGSWIRKINQMCRRQHMHNEDVLQIYKIQYKEKTIKNERYLHVNGISLHKKVTSKELALKVRNSFSSYFKDKSKDYNQMKISSINKPKNSEYIQVMFKSGESILITQNVSFPYQPNINNVLEYKLNIYGYDDKIYEKTYQRIGQQVQDSIGSQFFIINDRIVSNHEMSYMTPFSAEKRRKADTSLYKLKNQGSIINNNESLLMQHDGIVLVSELSIQYLLMIYCNMGIQNQKNNYVVNGMAGIQSKVNQLYMLYGSYQLVLSACNLLLQSRRKDKFVLKVRTDIYNLLHKQLQTGQTKSTSEWQLQYQFFNKEHIKHKDIHFTEEIQEILWNIVFKIQHMHTLQHKNAKNTNTSMQPICYGFQKVIEKRIRKIQKLTYEDFWFRKESINQLLLLINIIREIADKYLLKNKEHSIQHNIFLTQDNNHKVKYCQMLIKSMQKIKIILVIYEYFAEINLQKEKLPTIKEIIYGFDEDKRLKLSQFLLQNLQVVNITLLQQIEDKLPQLKLTTIKRFKQFINYYMEVHKDNNNSANNNNNTVNYSILNSYCLNQDPTLQESTMNNNYEIQQLANIICPCYYHQLQKYYINGGLTKDNDPNQHYQQQQHNNNNNNNSNKNVKNTNKSQNNDRVVKVLIALMKKVVVLKSKQMIIKNAIIKNKNTALDYYSSVENRNIEMAMMENTKQKLFYTIQAEKLVERIFNTYKEQKISKKELTQTIEIIRDEAPGEIRQKTQKCLSAYGLSQVRIGQTITEYLNQQIIKQNLYKKL